MRRSGRTFTVRITSVPPGEAPLWVREKWVGLELPICGPAIPRIHRTVGVVTGPSSLPGRLVAILRGRTQKTPGYMVSVEAALVALEEVSPDAAAWWRANAPGVVRTGRYLVFQETVCTPLFSSKYNAPYRPAACASGYKPPGCEHSYALTANLARSVVAEGRDSRFFITIDCAFGHSLESALT